MKFLLKIAVYVFLLFVISAIGAWDMKVNHKATMNAFILITAFVLPYYLVFSKHRVFFKPKKEEM
jgi:hypothetical protein